MLDVLWVSGVVLADLMLLLLLLMLKKTRKARKAPQLAETSGRSGFSKFLSGCSEVSPWCMRLVIALALVAFAGTSHAAQKLIAQTPAGSASDSVPGDLFGNRVVISGDVAAVTSARDLTLPPDFPEAAFNDSPVYLFRKTGDVWGFEQRIPGEGEFEGGGLRGLALSGNVLMIGAPHNGVNQTHGLVRAYRYNQATQQWVFEQTLEEPDETKVSGDLFGTAIALSEDGTLAIIGAPQTNTATRGGYARIYRYSGATWVQEGGRLVANGDCLLAIIEMEEPSDRSLFIQFITLDL